MSINQDKSANYVDSSYFTFKTFRRGEDPYTEDMIFALRYQVYCLERVFLPPSNYPDGLEIDEYDDYSTYVSATNQSNLVVGGLRVVSPPEGKVFPFQTHCKRLFKDTSLPPTRDCVEVSRVVISKVYRRRADDTRIGVSSGLLNPPPDQASITVSQKNEHGRKQHPEILLGILRQAYRHCKKTGVSYWYVAIEPALARLLQRINFGFEAIGEEEDYYGPVTPYILAINKFESDLSRNNPAMFAWFQAALDESDRVSVNTNEQRARI